MKTLRSQPMVQSVQGAEHYQLVPSLVSPSEKTKNQKGLGGVKMHIAPNLAESKVVAILFEEGNGFHSPQWLEFSMKSTKRLMEKEFLNGKHNANGNLSIVKFYKSWGFLNIVLTNNCKSAKNKQVNVRTVS